MNTYSWRGKNGSGESLFGRIVAENPGEVARRLSGQGVTPIHIGLAEEVAQSAAQAKTVRNIRPNDLLMFTRQMYTITRSSLPLVRGIKGLAASSQHEGLRSILTLIASRLESGQGLSEALTAASGVFDKLYTGLVSVGEATGHLEEVFAQLCAHIERDIETRKKIKSAVRYPIFVISTLIAAFVLVNIFVIPAFASMFQKMNTELPALTKLLMATSELCVNYWPVGLAVTVGGFFVARLFIKTEQGAYWWGKRKLSLPLVGPILLNAYMSRYAYNLSLMHGAGVALRDSLRLCADALGNPYLQEQVNLIRERISTGETLTRTHAQAGIFPPLVIEMISLGEESGRLEELLAEVAEFYEREVDYAVDAISSTIEPMLIVALTFLVGILAMGVFIPMWDIYSAQA